MKSMGIIIWGVIFALMVSLSAIYTYGTKSTAVCTFDSKEKAVVVSGEDISSQYRIYCDEESFVNQDNLWYWKFNSADIQTKFKVGKKYELIVFGWRIPFFSLFRDIISVKEI